MVRNCWDSVREFTISRDSVHTLIVSFDSEYYKIVRKFINNALSNFKSTLKTSEITYAIISVIEEIIKLKRFTCIKKKLCLG